MRVARRFKGHPQLPAVDFKQPSPVYEGTRIVEYQVYAWKIPNRRIGECPVKTSKKKKIASADARKILSTALNLIARIVLQILMTVPAPANVKR
jgi:hypothetical protein